MSLKLKIVILILALAVVIFITSAGVFSVKKREKGANATKDTSQMLLSSIFNNPEEYGAIFSELKKPIEDSNAQAGIISHHFLARQLIADFYNRVGSDNISTVFLVSPDHYDNYFKPGSIAYTSYLNWNTPFAQLNADGDLISSLLINNKIEIKNSAMGLEHGVYTEIPFIRKFFPNAKVVPLVLKNNLPYPAFLALGEDIKKIAGQSSILIVSSDFSHEASTLQAGINDKKSIDILKNVTAGNINQITNDCKQCIATLSGFLDGKSDNFTLINNKNSFDVSGQDEDSVTSYVSGYYSKKDYAKILFTGDTMFDRGIRSDADKNGGNKFIFDNINSFLADKDLVVSNLEGPITNSKSRSAGTAPGSDENYFFTFNPSVAKTLFEENIRLVDLGNNHILNFGQPGVNSTEKYLAGAGVDYFGGTSKSIVETIHGIKIGFVSYNQFSKNNSGEEQKATIAEIGKLKKESDVVVVFSHWGTEYSLNDNDFQKNLAHQFVDAGADLIIGSHPHVIEPSEVYKGKKIYYSLGNFVFDQYFSEDVRNGLGVEVKIDKKTKELQFSEQKFYLQSNGQTMLK